MVGFWVFRGVLGVVGLSVLDWFLVVVVVSSVFVVDEF